MVVQKHHRGQANSSDIEIESGRPSIVCQVRFVCPTASDGIWLIIRSECLFTYQSMLRTVSSRDGIRFGRHNNAASMTFIGLADFWFARLVVVD